MKKDSYWELQNYEQVNNQMISLRKSNIALNQNFYWCHIC